MEQREVKGRLRNKVFLMMALVSVVPVFVAGFISIYGIRTAHRADVANLEDALISREYSAIRNFLDRFIKDGASILIFRTTGNVDTDPETKKFLFEKILAGNPEVTTIATFDFSGKETFRIEKGRPEAVPSNELGSISVDDPGFVRAKAGSYYISPIEFSEAGPIITIVTPLLHNETAVAVYMAKVNLDAAGKIIQNVSIGKTGYLYLVDQNGKVLGAGINGPAPSADMKSVGIVQKILEGNDLLGAENQARYKNFFEEPVIAAGKFFPDLKWGLIAEWPTKEADAVIASIIWRNLIVLFLVLIAVIALSIVLANFVVRPVRALKRGTEFVAQGKFDTEVRIKTGDELEELGRAFNKMIVGLRQLEELKNEFVFIAAHELRTPVAAMKGYLTLILDGLTGPITEKTKDFMQKVVNSNQRLIQLVNDLLEVSRSEGGKLTIKVAPIDVVAPIQEVLVELQSLADKSSVTMNYEPAFAEASAGMPPASLPKVLADSARLKEVIVNLVGNSIKYMGPATGSTDSPQASSGQAASRIVTINHELKDNELITHIKDTGLGISLEAQKKLFEKFYRVSTDKTKDIQGTGLGLFIVKEIIEKMNGKIWVESEEGRGSTFSFGLPLA